MEFNNEVITHIETLLLGCDDSILSIDFLNDYKVESINIEKFRYIQQITDGSGGLLFDYNSKLNPIQGRKYFRLYKDRKDVIKIILESNKNFPVPNSEIQAKMDEFLEREERYIYRIINLLRIFKHGYIGFKHIFFEQELAFVAKQTNNTTILNGNRNAIRKDYYTLSRDEILSCNQFLKNYIGVVYDAMENVIDLFDFALDQIGIETSFEKFISALETMLIIKGEPGKKETLAKRVAVMLGKNDSNIAHIYSKVKTFYKYRSESTHEAKYSNITDINVNELEEITRAVIKKYFEICQAKLLTCSTILWEEIKRDNVAMLKSIVAAKQSIF